VWRKLGYVKPASFPMLSARLKLAVSSLSGLALAQAAALWVLQQPHTTSDLSEPVLTFLSDGDSDEALHGVNATIHDMLQHGRQQQSLSGAFARSRSVVSRFNLAGLERAFENQSGLLRPFFDKVRPEGANAFVLNSLVIDGKPCKGSLRHATPSVGSHMDTTVWSPASTEKQ
jgi:hypothetical protein